MKKRLLLVLLSVVFLFGCTQDDVISTGSFVGGDNGLEITFVNGEPPSEVFDDNEEEFDISISIENVGEFDIPQNKIISTLSGIDVRDFGISGPNVIFKRQLEGKSKNVDDSVQRGEQDEIRYENAKYKFDLVADFETSVRADICYLYETKATTKVCIKKKATDIEDDDACDIDTSSLGIDNSGAPIQIRGVSQRSSGTNEVQFNFVVENRGGGKVHPPTTFTNTCERNEDKEDRLNLEVTTSSGRHKVDCSQLDKGTKGEVKLTDGERQIRCRVSTTSAPDGAVEEPINVVASYFYRTALSTDLIVEDSDR